MTASVAIRREITWMDTDASTYWHNTTAMRLVEQAESFLHRSLVPEEPFLGPVRVSVEVAYRSRMALHDLATVMLRVDRVGNTSIGYSFTIHNQHATLCAEGRLVGVQVDHYSGTPRCWTALHRERLLTASHLDEDARRLACVC